jgi:signal transduction histidine kinase
MRLRTRLLLPLIATVTAVMALYANWALRQREATLVAEDRREAVTFATALGLALEAALVDPEWRGVQDVVQRLARDPQIHGVRVYGTDGSVAFESATLEGEPPADAQLLQRVIELSDTAAYEREVEGNRTQVLLRPLRGEEGQLIGAFELTLGLSFVEAEIARTRVRFLLNTVTLVVALTVLTLWLVRRQIGEPLERLVAGVKAVGAGELAFRIQEDPRAADLAVVAREFNSRAERLERAREDLLREADERVDLERRFRESDKLAAVGRLAAGLAHEIATPLQIIKGRTDMLEGKEVTPTVHARNLRIISEQIDRVTSLVRALLDLSRRSDLQRKRVAVVDLVSEVSDLLEAELKRVDVDMRMEIQADAFVDADRNLLHQALMNLVLNAVQALEDHPGKRRISVRSSVLSGAVAIEIVDTGPGIPEGAIDRIFEPFFSTKTDSRGTGLGLSISRTIVEEHGGSLRAENVTRPEAGGRVSVAGARFLVELPLSGAPEVAHV